MRVRRFKNICLLLFLNFKFSPRGTLSPRVQTELSVERTTVSCLICTVENTHRCNSKSHSFHRKRRAVMVRWWKSSDFRQKEVVSKEKLVFFPLLDLDLHFRTLPLFCFPWCRRLVYMGLFPFYCMSPGQSDSQPFIFCTNWYKCELLRVAFSALFPFTLNSLPTNAFFHADARPFHKWTPLCNM